jgi:hypothetical protein
MIRRGVVLAPLLALAAFPLACGAGGAASQGSGIRGVVDVVPACPSYRVGSSCPRKPARGARVEIRAATSGRVVRSAYADDRGRFRVVLAPGRYVVTADVPGKRGYGRRRIVLVAAGEYTRVRLAVDTGIR